jgi:hypothetical protein
MLQRSYGLVDAVIDCVDAYNLVAAAPRLRTQLDTLVRACYVANAGLSDDIVKALFEGTEFPHDEGQGRKAAQRRAAQRAR